ncbi:hypothetical protein ACIQZI_03885 [Peribacillus sp. NPDC096379]|uniref:hypothetical protein n=1 Tax=Peribacillus sp. NPDC096379 TaxID=3364393 RepID=UPI0037F86119
MGDFTFKLRGNSKYRTMLISLNNLVIISLFICVILVRDIYGVSISKYFLILLAFMLFLINDKNIILGFFAFIIPISSGVSYNFIIGIGLLILIIKNKENIKLKFSSVFYILIILIIELLSSVYGYFSIGDFIRFLPFLLLILVVMADKHESYNHELILKFYLLGFIIMTIDIIGQTLKYYSFDEIILLGVRFGSTRQILDIYTEGQLISLNPNSLGVYSVIAISIGLLLYNINKSNVYIFIIIYTTVFGIMSQSRTFIIVFFFVIFFHLLTTSITVKKALRSILLITLILSIIYLIGTKLLPEYGVSFVKRFTEVNDLTNGRNEIMNFYFQGIFNEVNKMLFGVGIQNYNLKFDYLYSLHNATLEVVAIWGIVGFILICLLFRDFFRNAIRDYKYRIDKSSLTISLAFLISIQSGQGFSIYNNILMLIICYSSIRLGSLYEEKNRIS